MSLAVSRSTSRGGVWPAVLAVLSGAAVAAFWKPYLAHIGAGVDVFTHVHAGTMAAWLFLLTGQAFLIRHERRRAHRALGRLSYALMPAVVGAAIALAVHRLRLARADLTTGHAELLFVQLGSMGLLAAFYILAMVRRRRPPEHARYMVGTGLTMIDPIAARAVIHLAPSWGFLVPHIVWLVTVPALMGLIVFEPRGRRWRSPFAVLLAAFALYQAAVPIVGRSAVWMSAVRWLAG